MFSSFSLKAWPTFIRFKKSEKKLVIEFHDGARFEYTAEYLRVESPSAEVKGHSINQKRIIPSCRNVAINSLERIGNYAIRILFNDQHETGIYSWDYLYKLGQCHEENWQHYLKMLEALGLSRD